MYNSLKQYEVLFLFIFQHYGFSDFTTGEIYSLAPNLGIPAGSVGGHLNTLKRKGLLTNRYLRRTSTGHVMKMWRVTCPPEEQLQKGGH
ncbi:hypothetical protein [Latilactobacillus graminis]|uniref:LexA repressor DNA-binding domain-containing protein n=1 Tax=Latilactobacillus graminis TaxID=60519 RepID=A0ABX6C978_9LACO|nr:hypothetical protein [Latilactobacillus graminis]QFP78805.1 hypothetical protein LG542_00420 [Latilactobacillus graminis]